MDKILKRFLFVKIVSLWILTLITGSLLPEAAKIALRFPSGQPAGGQTIWPHRLVHYVAFGSITLFLVMISKQSLLRHSALFATVALGVGIEALQHVLYHADFEMTDVRDDVVAACVVYIIWHLVTMALSPGTGNSQEVRPTKTCQHDG